MSLPRTPSATVAKVFSIGGGLTSFIGVLYALYVNDFHAALWALVANGLFIIEYQHARNYEWYDQYDYEEEDS